MSNLEIYEISGEVVLRDIFTSSPWYKHRFDQIYADRPELKKHLLILLGLCRAKGFLINPSADKSRYYIDLRRDNLSFRIRHMGRLDVRIKPSYGVERRNVDVSGFNCVISEVMAI